MCHSISRSILNNNLETLVDDISSEILEPVEKIYQIAFCGLDAFVTGLLPVCCHVFRDVIELVVEPGNVLEKLSF